MHAILRRAAPPAMSRMRASPVRELARRPAAAHSAPPSSFLSRAAAHTARAAAQTAHSPSPRCTTNGTLRFQSMNWFMVSSPNSTGMARSRTASSKALVPTRSA